MKIQGHSSSESPLEYNKNQVPSCNQGWLWPSWPTRVLRILCSLILVLEGKAGEDIYLSHQI